MRRHLAAASGICVTRLRASRVPNVPTLSAVCRFCEWQMMIREMCLKPPQRFAALDKISRGTREVAVPRLCQPCSVCSPCANELRHEHLCLTGSCALDARCLRSVAVQLSWSSSPLHWSGEDDHGCKVLAVLAAHYIQQGPCGAGCTLHPARSLRCWLHFTSSTLTRAVAA
eukprot:2570998-Pleurochrysis_carterae.AAC.2